jgi:hypothetical protein
MGRGSIFQDSSRRFSLFCRPDPTLIHHDHTRASLDRLWHAGQETYCQTLPVLTLDFIPKTLGNNCPVLSWIGFYCRSLDPVDWHAIKSHSLNIWVVMEQNDQFLPLTLRARSIFLLQSKIPRVTKQLRLLPCVSSTNQSFSQSISLFNNHLWQFA